MDGSGGMEDQTPQLCEICGKNAAVWVSIWANGNPRFTPIQKNVHYPELSTKLCDSCKEVSSTRFRP
jgi:hypothetical protein